MKNNSRLISIISILLIIGFFATSLASYFVSRKSLRTEIEMNSLPLTGDNIYSEIQQDLLKPVFISSLMASDTFLRDWVLTGEVNKKNITKFLKEIKRKYNTITAFLVSDKTKNYYHVDGILKKVAKDNPRDTWYFRVEQMEKEFEINVDLDMANQDAMTIFVNYRIHDYGGNYIGATGVGLTVRAVKNLIEKYQKKYDRSVFFIAKDGAVKLAGSNFPQSITNIHQKKNFPAYLTDRTDQNKYYRYQEGNQLIHANIRYISEFGWYLVVEQQESKTTHRILTTLFFNLAICLLITCIVIVLVRITIVADKKRIETLRGIVPICSYCKQIRDDKGYWNQVEEYVSKHTEAKFSHGICPNCVEKHYPGYDLNK